MKLLETKEKVAYTSHETISEEVTGLTSLNDWLGKVFISIIANTSLFCVMIFSLDWEYFED